ncbi:hypothetical protein PR202_ga24940 [Eleusine coracana subsp. coracana]|uniref:Uncharacterized protein n=1 Tax=Eleusine coracana subsp. coracana TaxID=191504 RepID=A0AAV5D885_ELECO|nr:hypothetical protein QOZ80_9AG0672750 [Eleusine coracana subsp. coracana]GJN07138.1 hypothetical protein PR202_ga24940 [Eleusine coracana subsp. coracana]
MATLTPGVLLKLLQSMHTDERVAGEHRSPVLQVTAVVPALTASTADSLLSPTNGFLLNLSDGLHSTYVQLPPADADALLSAARPHLVGHLVHLDRLRFARPVPRAVGLRPVPSSSRALPCAGNPEPLVARAAACARGYAIQPAASPSDAAPPLMPSSTSNIHESSDAVKRTPLAHKNIDAAPPPGGSAASAVKRRFSSPAPSKQRDPSLSVKGGGGGDSRASSPAVTRATSRASSPAVRGTTPRATSPAPSKCVVPSLVAAKEENRRAAREPAIVVPSRYRQPSPSAGRRGGASPAVGGRRASLSPSSRRLSGEGAGKKRVGVLVAGISKMTDLGNGSVVKPVRKSWDDPTLALAAAATGSVMKSRAKVDKNTILRTQEAMSRRLSDATSELSSNDGSSVDDRPKPRKKIDSVKMKNTAPKVTLHDPKWTDGSIPLDAVSDRLANLGKEAIERRNAAAAAAASALQEALITESVMRNLSKFSEICSLSKTSNPLPTIDLFLVIYEDTLKWKTMAEAVVTDGEDEAFLEKSTTHWVDAALATDLEVLKLLNGATESISRMKRTNNPKTPSVVQPSKTSMTKKQSVGASAKVQSKVSPNSPVSCTWSTTESMNETVELAKTLWREMHMWFLNFLNEALDVGFHLFEDQNVASKVKHGSHITTVLSQFKKISDWLDQVGKIAEDKETKEKIESLKRKIYGFVISHMGSALESSVTVS